jgi:hypothetical protein
MLISSISVKNTASPWLESSSKEVKQALIIGLYSTGKFMREIIQRQGRTGASGSYLGWAKLNPYTGTIDLIREGGRHTGRTRYLNPYRGRGKGRWRYGARAEGGGFEPGRTMRSKPPLAKIISAVRYEVLPSQLVVRAGFLLPRLWGMVEGLAEAKDTPITASMRRMLFGIGAGGLGALSVLHQPARPWFEPIRAHEEEDIQAHFAERFFREMRARGMIV